MIRTPLRSAAATWDQPASLVCPVFAPTSGSFPISPSVDVSVLPPAMVAVGLADHVRMNGLRSAAESSVVTSRALETWPGWSSPCGFSKCVDVRPSDRAFAFISLTNRGTEPPPTCTASAVAASFALGTRVAIARSRTVSRSPTRSLALDSPTPAASGVTVTTSSRRARSSATSTVISFVMLAGARCASGARTARTTASGPPRTR